MGAPAPRTGRPAFNYTLRSRTRCAGCGRPIWWGTTAKQRRAPFDLVDGEPTHTIHFATCPARRRGGKGNLP